MKIENRFFIFIAISIIGINGYQCYFNYKTDKHINQALSQHNSSTSRYVEIINEEMREKELLQGAVEHWRSMYRASKSSNCQLEEQIDVISNYWKVQYLKVSDELFDVKNKK